MKQRSLFSALPLSLLALLLLPSWGANAAPWYRVEVILVAYQDENLMNKETWPESLPLPDVKAKNVDLTWWLNPAISNSNAMLGSFGFGQAPQAKWDLPMQPLPTRQLLDAAKRIQARKDMKVIWHKAWVEPIQEQENAIVHPLDIRLADKFDIHLSGSINLYRSRFLHINTDLVMQHNDPIGQVSLEALQQDFAGVESDQRSDVVTHAALEIFADETPQVIPIRAAHIKQSRRMRSGELHYIDHPFLGIVVRATPVTDAASL